MPQEVSIGEFDGRSGLTHVTLQRGRLLFNMGAPSTAKAVWSRSSTPAHVDASTDCRITHMAQHLGRPMTSTPRVFRSGIFCGRSLYPEEAYFLLHREALVVYEMEEVVNHDPEAKKHVDDRTPLSLERFVHTIITNHNISMPYLDVYVFLKECKLHPRRHVSPFGPVHGDMDIAFDVMKSITKTEYVEDTVEVAVPSDLKEEGDGVKPSWPFLDKTITGRATTKLKKRKVKHMHLIFRVIMCRYDNIAPRPSDIRLVIERMRRDLLHDKTDSVPLKLAIVQNGQGVLMMEVA